MKSRPREELREELQAEAMNIEPTETKQVPPNVPLFSIQRVFKPF